MTICDVNGNKYENEAVAEQFLKHFQGFLGKKDNVVSINQRAGLFETVLTNEEAHP